MKSNFPFLSKKSETEARCNHCNSSFSIAHGGNSDISDHVKSAKHKKSVTAISQSSSMFRFFRPVVGDSDEGFKEAEGV